jgi:hypothetical protein
LLQAKTCVAFAIWFATIGPFAILPVTILALDAAFTFGFQLGAHFVGFIPGVLTGLVIAYRYARESVPVIVFWNTRGVPVRRRAYRLKSLPA